MRSGCKRCGLGTLVSLLFLAGGSFIFLEDGHVKLIRTKRIAIPDGDYLYPLNFKDKPTMPDLEFDDYSPENSDNDDDSDGDAPEGPDAKNQGRKHGYDKNQGREKMLAIVEDKAVDEALEQLERESEKSKEKSKEKKDKDKEYSLFEIFYDPTVDPKRLPDGRKTPDGFVWDGMRLIRERKGSKRVPGFPSSVPNKGRQIGNGTKLS